MTDAELREIDARIHQEVMGVIWDESRCRVCGWTIVPEGDQGCWASNCSMRPMPERRADEVPSYSSRIELAWLVIERLKTHFRCSIRFSNKTVDWCWWCYIYAIDEEMPDVVVQEQSAPLAICLAALKAVSTKET